MDGFPKLFTYTDTTAVNRGTSAEPRDGDVLAFRGCGFFSALIRHVTCARVTHVGFVVTVHGRKCVLEARERHGVQLIPLAVYRADTSVRVDWYRLKSEQYGIDRHVLIDEAFDHLGQRYASIWQFLRSWGLIGRTLGDYLRWPADLEPKRFFCSEFVLCCLRKAGYIANGDLLPAQTSPGDVIEFRCLESMGAIA